MSGLGKWEKTKHTEELYIVQAMDMFGFGGGWVFFSFWGLVW